MFNLIVEVQYLDVANCFLHLSPKIFDKLKPFVSRCVKGLVVNSQAVVYFTTSATACNSLGSDVGISPLYASLLQLHPGDKIILTPLDSSPSLCSVLTNPVSEDDHQILELASGDVEASLLNQLRIVWPKQCFPVWISPSITAKLVVDSVEPDIEFGSLVEDTKLVIGDVKDCSRLINKCTEEQLPENNENVTSSEKASLKNNSLSRSELLFESFISRLVPEKNVCPPYHVNLSEVTYPEWIVKDGGSAVFQIKSCVDPSSKVFVNFCIGTPSVLDVGPYKSLPVSKCIFNHLSLDVGSKVVISPTKQFSNELSSILITPCLRLKKNLDFNEIESLFRKKLNSFCVKWGRCLLNSKGIFPLDDDTFVTTTLRPLSLQWAFVTLISLNSLPISVNTLETSSVLSTAYQDVCEIDSSCFAQCLPPNISSLLEHSLRLKEGTTNTAFFKNNFVLVGKPGCGKTYLSNHILNEMSKFPYYIHVEKIDCSLLKGKRLENVGKIISSHLSSCRLKQPAVFVMDNIDVICGTFSPELEKAETSFHIQRASQKIADLLEASTQDLSILVFATCENTNSINNILFKRRGHSIFSTVIPIQPKTLIERKLLMEKTIVDRTSTTENSLKDLNLSYYASLTDGYVSADIIRFIEKAIFEASQRFNSFQNELVLIRSDLEKAFESSSFFMNNKLKVQKHSDLKLSDIGGLRSVKERLVEIVVWPSKYGSLLNQCPLKKQTGVLIYGAPGSGKTMLAKAIALESNLNFITVKGPELMSKYIGGSEEGVRRVFENAQAAKPSLLFFDEFESLAPRRGDDQTGVTDRVVNQLLTALDGVEPISGVTVVAASSRPDLIDPALLRSGRLSHHLFCSFPDEDERFEILSLLTASVNLADDIDFRLIAQRTDNFSGADLKGLLTTAQIQMFDKLGESNEPTNGLKAFSEGGRGEIKLTQSDLLDALSQTKPSLGQKDRNLFASIYSLFSKGKVVDITKQRAVYA